MSEKMNVFEFVPVVNIALFYGEVNVNQINQQSQLIVF